MNRFCIIFIFSLCVLFSYGNDFREQQVRSQIAHIDSIYSTISSKQQKDTLVKLLENYRILDTIMTQSIEQKDSILKEYIPYKDILFLLSGDTSVFRKDYSNEIKIPKSLEYHFQTIKMITSARMQIEAIEQKIVRISENYAQDMLKSGQILDLKAQISSEIEGDMDVITELLKQLMERNLSSLSSEQYQYFRPGLTERYNKFIKFFE